MIAIVSMGLHTCVLMLLHNVPGWKQGFRGQSTATDKQGSYL